MRVERLRAVVHGGARVAAAVAMVAGLSGTAKAATIDVNQPVTTSNISAFSSNPTTAQSFMTNAGNISGAGIFLNIPTIGVPYGTVSIDLYTGLPNAGGTLLTGASAQGAEGWFDVFWAPETVLAGATYYLVFEADPATGGIRGSTSNPYPGGHVFANSTFNSFPTFDFAFRTWTGPVNAVPLPAALPLFGTGLALMGFVGWRRKRASAA